MQLTKINLIEVLEIIAKVPFRSNILFKKQQYPGMTKTRAKPLGSSWLAGKRLK